MLNRDDMTMPILSILSGGNDKGPGVLGCAEHLCILAMTTFFSNYQRGFSVNIDRTQVSPGSDEQLCDFLSSTDL